MKELNIPILIVGGGMGPERVEVARGPEQHLHGNGLARLELVGERLLNGEYLDALGPAGRHLRVSR